MLFDVWHGVGCGPPGLELRLHEAALRGAGHKTRDYRRFSLHVFRHFALLEHRTRGDRRQVREKVTCSAEKTMEREFLHWK